MAESFNDDDDLERLKSWWRTNGLSLIVGAVVGLVAILGWQGWQHYSEAQALAASALFDQFQTLRSEDAPAEELLAVAIELREDYGSSPYAPRATLALADYYVQQEDYPAAIQQLEWVIDYAAQEPFRHLAQVRKARLLWAQGEADAALALLASDHPPVFDALYAELTGDIHAAAGALAEAAAAYRQALNSLPADADPLVLQRKLANVATPVAEVS